MIPKCEITTIMITKLYYDYNYEKSNEQELDRSLFLSSFRVRGICAYELIIPIPSLPRLDNKSSWSWINMTNPRFGAGRLDSEVNGP